MLCALNDEDGVSKILTVNITDGTTEEIIDQKEKIYTFDMEKVPGTEENYFIIHQSTGLSLIEPSTKRISSLRIDSTPQFNTCNSVALTLINDEDPSEGFWLANIDNQIPNSPVISCFDFDAAFMSELKKLSDLINAGKENE